MVAQTRISAEEFDRIAALPENADKRLEFIGGEIIELVSDTYASELGIAMGSEIRAYVKRNNLGRVTGADGGYIVYGERYIPDVGFISLARQPERVRAAYNPLAPDLAVEVVSPTDTSKQIANYLAAGTVVWVLHPDEQEIKVFEPGLPVKTLGLEDTLNGGSVLPGFEVAVKDIFAV